MKATYEVYDTSNPWSAIDVGANPYYERELDIVRKAVSAGYWPMALDLGAGYGRASAALRRDVGEFVLMDGSARMLDEARARGSTWPCVVADIDQPWPFSGGSFDLVVGLQIINHARDLHAFFRELARVLKPKGAAFLSVGNAQSYVGVSQRRSLERDGFRRLRIGAIEEIGQSSGLITETVGGSGLASPHGSLCGLDLLNWWRWTARISHLVVLRFVHVEVGSRELRRASA